MAAVDVAWGTCLDLPEVDTDEELTLAALRAAGLSVERVAWDDPDPRPATDFRLCVVRSTWDYPRDPAAFQAWVARMDAGTRLLNSGRVCAWNLHKRYLFALEAAGIPIIPTRLVERGSDAAAAEWPWVDVVLKPAVSAGSYLTRRFDGDPQGARAFLAQTLLERDMLVQEFVPDVDVSGERNLIWIDGAFTHVVLKAPRFADDDESVSAAKEPLEEELLLGERVLTAACADGGFTRAELLYARVDSVQHGGRRVLSELELLEPSLFLRQSPAALQAFVNALRAKLALE